MSFGFGIGDFFTVVSFAYDIYKRCRLSTSQFKDIAKEVGNAHIVLRNIHTFWDSENKRGRPLLVPQQVDLKEYTENCAKELQRLEVILKKNEGLGVSGTMRARANFAWRNFIDDFASIRGRLQAATGALAVFHSMLTGDALARASHEQTTLLRDFKDKADILSFFVRSYQDFWSGARTEPAYSQASKAADQPADTTYQAATGELYAEGISDSAIKTHHLLIKEWIDTVILAPTADEGDGDDNDNDNDEGVPANAAAAGDADATNSAASTTIVNEQTATQEIQAGHLDDPERQREEARSGHDGQIPVKESQSSVDPTSPQEEPAPLIPRSRSVSTHRSQSSTWEDPGMQTDSDDQDYASIMIAKVLRSKYPPGMNDEPFRLPVRRAFHLLDCTSRGWLTRSQVEKTCIDAASLTGWNFDSQEVASVVMLEDSKGNNPDHRIDPDEFFNIVLEIRAGIKSVTVRDSTKIGLIRAVAELSNWFKANKARQPLSEQWRLNYHSRMDANGQWHKIPVFNHELDGELPDWNIPLNCNLTNAIYLAVQFSMSNLDAAARNWQAELRKLPVVEQDEYVQALNNVVSATSTFHQLEDKGGVDLYHPVDLTLDYAFLVPISEYEELRDFPSKCYADVYIESWDVLRPILSFVHDLGVVNIKKPGSKGIPLPQLKRWRKLRMLHRSQEISASATRVQNLGQPLKDAQNWQRERLKALKGRYDACIDETRRLREAQEREAQLAFFTTLEIDVGLNGVPHLLFRKPSTLLEMRVDGEEATSAYGSYFYDLKQSVNPRWGRRILFKKSSTIRLDFYDCSKGSSKQQLLGSLEFKASDVVDFNRRSRVEFSRPLKDGKSTLIAKIEVTPFLTSSWGYSATNPDPEPIESARLKLPLAKYILCHPIPPEWEIRRDADRGEGWLPGGVFFRNRSTGQNTATLWKDPLASKCPNAPLEPLPSGWKRDQREGSIVYRDATGGTANLSERKPDGTETFEHVLEPFLFSKPSDFYGQ